MEKKMGWKRTDKMIGRKRMNKRIEGREGKKDRKEENG